MWNHCPYTRTKRSAPSRRASASQWPVAFCLIASGKYLPQALTAISQPTFIPTYVCDYRFSINFVIENSTRDVALQINPRLPQNYIVRNTKAKGVWGKEEVSSALPFSLHRGSKFAIQIFITDSDYLISVNGIHFAKYAHRLPYTSVSTIEVKGDVENVSMERGEVECYPEHIPGFNPK